MQEIGLCQCGCGQKTKISTVTHIARGKIKGEPFRYIHGHNTKKPGSNWYSGICQNGKRKNLHTAIAEMVLGKKLPQKAVVHHIDGDKRNNTNGNLIICENQAYHKLLHRRERALIACGNVNWRKCNICKEYDDPFNLYISKGHCHHFSCSTNYKRERMLKCKSYSY